MWWKVVTRDPLHWQAGVIWGLIQIETPENRNGGFTFVWHKWYLHERKYGLELCLRSPRPLSLLWSGQQHIVTKWRTWRQTVWDQTLWLLCVLAKDLSALGHCLQQLLWGQNEGKCMGNAWHAVKSLDQWLLLHRPKDLVYFHPLLLLVFPEPLRSGSTQVFQGDIPGVL